MYVKVSCTTPGCEGRLRFDAGHVRPGGGLVASCPQCGIEHHLHQGVLRALVTDGCTDARSDRRPAHARARHLVSHQQVRAS